MSATAISPRAHFSWLGGILLLALLGISNTSAARALASPRAPNDAASVVRAVEILTPLVPRYEKFEASFQIETDATNFSLPFDAAAPPGAPRGVGITVDGLFSNDAWQTTIVQPAFWYQPVSYTAMGARNHLLPEGAPEWRVRFAPQAIGDWQFRIRVQDRNGITVYPPQGAFKFYAITDTGRRDALRIHSTSRHGFLRVSENDSRYFEFQDGTPFLGLGYNVRPDILAESEARLRAWERNGIQFARMWMSNDGINGWNERPWIFPKGNEANSDLDALLDSRVTFGDAPLSFRIDAARPCMFGYFGSTPLAVKPNTTYSITLRAKLTGVEPKANASEAGLTVMEFGWGADPCADIKAKPLVAPRVGTTDWFTATGTLTIRADQYFVDFLHIALKDVARGAANIDEIRLTEQADPAQVNLLRRGRADSHLYFDYVNAAKWDEIIESAARHGVYLKIVIDEKNEWVRNHLTADGTFGQADNNNFYAAPNTAVRWLQEAWWRYVIARWGYSTAIHSFEYVNEGDPYNGNHYQAAAAMAEYFDAHDPARHMVTTSMWHSFPAAPFWANPKYAALDYADIHAYTLNNIDSDTGTVPESNFETRPAFVHSGTRSLRLPAAQKVNFAVTPRGLTLDEPGEWIIRYWLKAEQFRSQCILGSTGSMVHVRWTVDGGTFYGGKEGIVPPRPDGKDFLCASPDGTFDWREFSSQTDRSDKPIPMEQRLVITDTLPHELLLYVQNSDGIAGQAWLDDIQIISPSGKPVPVLGTFEERNFVSDTAWFTAAYSLLWGPTSPTSVRKPLVRGEAGLSSVEFPDGIYQANRDQQGIWLHNYVWGQINPGGMYDLYWWSKGMIENNPQLGRSGDLYFVFAPFAKFMQDIPLNNGHYRDAKAVASDPRLRVWGQRDDVNGRAHLWIQNTAHQWDAVVAGKTIAPVNGVITLRDMPKGTCRVEWWDTYTTRESIVSSETILVTDTLALKLPAPLETDIAARIQCARE